MCRCESESVESTGLGAAVSSTDFQTRYANHKGGKKYEKSSLELEREQAAQEVGNPNHSKLKRTELPKSTGHAGQEEKLAASEIFKVLWRECTSDEAYLKLKGEWQKEKKDWLKAGGKVKKDDGIWKGYEHDGGNKSRVKNEKEIDSETVKTEPDTGVKIKKEEGDSDSQ